MYNAFETSKPLLVARIFEQIFMLKHIGYVAAEIDGALYMQAHPDLQTDTTPISNFFEETIVNPTVLNLLRRRGDIDCGGVRYFAVGYGDFVQLILPFKSGHLSIGVPSRRNVPRLVDEVVRIIDHDPTS